MSTLREQLLSIIREQAIVRGPVTLSSGAQADYYVDLRRVTLDGVAAPLVGQVMNDLVVDLEIDAVGGLTMGADPVATAMLHAAGAQGRRLDAFVVRKAGKAHGMQQQIEGPSIEGRRVLVVEDTSTTGNSPLTAVAACRAAGADVVAVAVIADRDSGADRIIAEQGLEYRAAFALSDLGLG
ncbi:MAG: orotate phosphoribosyltransferase [Ornithinimicrobium sp.]